MGTGLPFWILMTIGFADKIEWQLRAIEQFKSECGACVWDARLVNKSNNMDTTAFRLVGKCYKELIGILPTRQLI